MIKRDELIQFIYKTIGKDLLKKAEEKDELANGIQILGGKKVEKVTLGTSLNEDFLKEVISIGSNFCVFHHGFDSRTYKSSYPSFSQKRLKLIFQHEITIAGFHYALDAHPEIGNNATIIKLLGAQIDQPLFEEWGFTGKFSTLQDVKQLADKCAKIFEHDVFAVYSGPKKVTTIGATSGAGKPSAQHIKEMENKGVELFITGEPSESVPHKMKESGINYFAGGHYATEVFGVQELGKVIKSHFKDRLEVEFIDIPNPI